MSDVVELQKKEAELTQLNARLGALDQFTNGVLKDLIDTKTNLNLYMKAHNELTHCLGEHKVQIDNLNAQVISLTSELDSLKDNTQATCAVQPDAA